MRGVPQRGVPGCESGAAGGHCEAGPRAFMASGGGPAARPRTYISPVQSITTTAAQQRTRRGARPHQRHPSHGRGAPAAAPGQRRQRPGRLPQGLPREHPSCSACWGVCLGMMSRLSAVLFGGGDRSDARASGHACTTTTTTTRFDGVVRSARRNAPPAHWRHVSRNDKANAAWRRRSRRDARCERRQRQSGGRGGVGCDETKEEKSSQQRETAASNPGDPPRPITAQHPHPPIPTPTQSRLAASISRSIDTRSVGPRRRLITTARTAGGRQTPFLHPRVCGNG